MLIILRRTSNPLRNSRQNGFVCLSSLRLDLLRVAVVFLFYLPFTLICFYFFHKPQSQHTYRLLKPGLSSLFKTGPIRIQVCLRTERACIQTNRLLLTQTASTDQEQRLVSFRWMEIKNCKCSWKAVSSYLFIPVFHRYHFTVLDQIVADSTEAPLSRCSAMYLSKCLLYSRFTSSSVSLKAMLI